MGIMESPPATPSSAMTVPDRDKKDREKEDDSVASALDFQQAVSQRDAIIRETAKLPLPSVKLSDFQPLGSHPVTSSDEEITSQPPDFTRRGIHIPTRTSSNNRTPTKRRNYRSASYPNRPMSTTPESALGTRSSSASVVSYESGTSSILPLQQKAPADDMDRLSPLLEDDPKNFDLLAPVEAGSGSTYSLELRSEQLFSKEHLQAIFNDAPSLLRFISFLSAARPKSVPILIYYLDALKAIRAINYANAVAEALEHLEDHEFTENPARPTVNAILEDKARQAFEVLIRDDLPAFITHVFIQVVSVSIRKRITGSLPPLLREASEGLAEVFCLSDPSRTDNPIIFASEEFHRTTQYGVGYAIGRNCRFLQGPRTSPHSIARLREAIREGKETSELILNYRRDGSPFMNLLMLAPLLDSRGELRYFIGAQVDVSGLVKDATDLDAFRTMLQKQDENPSSADEAKDEFRELCEMFNNAELDTVRRYGGSMHREHLEEPDDASLYHQPRLLLKDPTNSDVDKPISQTPIKPEYRLSRVYKHYLLLRPAPSLRILFTSPSLRVPGILQSRFLDRIGGSLRVRHSLAEALADGTRGVTARVRWLTSAAPRLEGERTDEGRPRWIHCTPLLGKSGAVGVWMVILVDDEKGSEPRRRFRPAPPVANEIRRRPNTSRTSSPEGFITEDSGEDFNPQSNRFSLPNGFLKRPAIEMLRRPGSAMSEQRSFRIGTPTTEPSINSFALV